MELMFLGTGAAEAIPSVFCRCPYCCEVRKNGGKDCRSRSSFRIDGQHQIDFSPDIYMQMTRSGLDLFELEHLLITHSHEDHFDMAEIITRECAVPNANKTLYIYMHKSGAEWGQKLLRAYMPEKSDEVIAKVLQKYQIVPVEYYQTFWAGKLKVSSVKASHKAFGKDEYGLNYLIQLPDGRSMLYATDTGWYCEETWDYLKGKRVDTLILETTFGGRQDRAIYPDGHLDARSFLLMLDRMESIGFIDSRTGIYATHINHKHDLLHEELQQRFDESRFRITVAYDGLKIG